MVDTKMTKKKTSKKHGFVEVTQAFSKKGNPTLKTIAKIVHEAAISKR